ncbi:type IV pili methyl-accepting chemotaxis transducer N-terminal domain-containing protein, partial [Rhodoferax sp.]|uniref:type IV pili methyl-accepting chemotaxis transducer N-terminal domain-containing protein n=1 Tax=Rhodoferax sp. TaxID=50421 RepID=UPI002ACE0BED
MQRRTLITAAGASLLALALPARAQVADLSDAINKAGRQRMLSQRMGKAWLALLQNVEKTSAQLVLDKSMALFDRQLVELKGFAPTPDVQATYAKLDTAWGDYKTALVGKAPLRDNAAALLQLDAKVLALAHQGTVQYEAALA